ncbi:Phospholipid/glycerol acyltransferase [Kangiella geojedonensis]|uniref:1-acyl-sn-glycerol-3-phosphate acyltransferase n=1 Tax=Kangiella geojedonensis TaxID=914150 RepID=A0A0F6TPQ9_9GAMM|nr:Phospholipid/glycerol acyltransferase [Kangiella geojedonensis]
MRFYDICVTSVLNELTVKKANLLRAWWVILVSIAATGKYSLLTLGTALFNRSESAKKTVRPKIDRVIYRWGTCLVNAVRLRWTVEGDLESQAEPGRRVIIVANHSSAYDIPLIFAALPGSIRMISKKELFKIPLLSRAMKTAEILSIDRQNRQQAIKDLSIAKEKMESGIRICMFPEGTRSSNGKLYPLKKGAIRLAIDTNALIIPVAIEDIYKVLPNKKWLQMRLNQKVSVKVGKAIDCREFEVADRNQLTELVYNSLYSMLSEQQGEVAS